MYGDNALMLLGGTPIAISLIPISALSERFSLIRYPIDDENAIDDISFNLENRWNDWCSHPFSKEKDDVIYDDLKRQLIKKDFIWLS